MTERKTPGEQIIEGAQEALAVAKGEKPAARIHIKGHAYMPVADHATEVERLERERDELSDYAFEATKAITSLTAGGSEYFAGKLSDGRYKADLAFCVQRIRERYERAMDGMKAAKVEAAKVELETVTQAEIGAEMKRLRTVRRLSIRAMARELNISPSTLCRVERGETPDMKTARAILAYAGACSCCGRPFTAPTQGGGE